MIMKKFIYIVTIALSVFGFASCSEDFFDTEYTTYLSSDKAAKLAAAWVAKEKKSNPREGGEGK